MLVFSTVETLALVCFTTSILALAQLEDAFAESNTCNATCQQLVTAGLTFETAQHALPNDPFYTQTQNFSSDLAPGTLLYAERVTDLTNYTVPSGLTLSRIIYTTTNLNGTLLPTSAYVLWPYTAYQPKSRSFKHGKIPMVGWAHGTSGITFPCAPSSYRSLQYQFILPFPLALAGFAVVAPDYSGLGVSKFSNGTGIPHAWGSFPARANDMANAILAAQATFPELSKDFVVMGHSQGGATAWAYAQRQAQTPLKGYLGTVAMAPGHNFITQIEAALANPTDRELQYSLSIQLLVITSVQKDYPTYNYSGFTDIALDRWQLAQKAGTCLAGTGLLTSDISLLGIGKQGWKKDPRVQSYGKQTSSGGKKFKGPLLLVAGEEDKVVPLSLLKTAVNSTCALRENTGESLELTTYQGLDHFPVISGSRLRWMDWVKARFDGVPAPKPGCKTTHVKGPRVQNTKQSVVPNWLVTLPGPKEIWELSF